MTWGVVGREPFTLGLWYDKTKTQQLKRVDVSFVVCLFGVRLN